MLCMHHGHMVHTRCTQAVQDTQDTTRLRSCSQHTWPYLASSSSLGQWGQVRYDAWVAHTRVVTL